MLMAEPGALHTPWRQTTHQESLGYMTACGALQANSATYGLWTLTTPPEVWIHDLPLQCAAS